MTRDLPYIATLLYGHQWQTPLAGLLGVSTRTVRRWEGEPPARVWAVVKVEALARVKQLTEWTNDGNAKTSESADL